MQGEARQRGSEGEDGNANQLFGVRNGDDGSVSSHARASCALPVLLPEDAASGGADFAVAGARSGAWIKVRMGAGAISDQRLRGMRLLPKLSFSTPDARYRGGNTFPQTGFRP